MTKGLLLLLSACLCCTPEQDLAFVDVSYLRGDAITTEPYSIGVTGKRITYLGRERPRAKRVVEGRGLVLAPGFLDTNSCGLMGIDEPGGRLKLADGVTSALSAHGGAVGEHLGNGSVLNYATTVGIGGMDKSLTDAQLLQRLGEGIKAGAYGVAFAPEYAARATLELVAAACAQAKGASVPISFHLRYSDPARELDGLREAISCAQLGAKVHVLHISSTGGTYHYREAAAAIAAANDRGLTVFADFYPYTSWASPANQSRFDGDWLERYRVGAGKVHIRGLVALFDQAEFNRLRSKLGRTFVAVDSIPPESMEYWALQSQATIGTDSPADSSDHPRGAGSFAKFINEYVDTGKTTLAQALYRFSTVAHERFSPFVPGLRERGRIEVGRIADLVLWNPARIRSNATFERPLAASSGVVAAVVNGVPVILGGQQQEAVLPPGEWLKGTADRLR